ncbi:MAG: sialate O-acetylesterase, partial [Treponema sp.]|jgi:lysophospholipase L1-like esterase|nr:sialate O-acetylesterase [Treponema sp.]
LHQGEGGGGAPTWIENVKRIYDNLLEDLSLEPNSIPLLAGQVHKNIGECNGFINTLPSMSDKFHIISSAGLTSAADAGSPEQDGPDTVHFSPEGMMALGRRYGEKAFELLYRDEYGTEE